MMASREWTVFLINRCDWSVGDVSVVWDERRGGWSFLLLHGTRDQREDSGGDRQGAAFKQVGSIFVWWNADNNVRWCVLRHWCVCPWTCLTGFTTVRSAAASSAGDTHSTRECTVKLAPQGDSCDITILTGITTHIEEFTERQQSSILLRLKSW